MGKKILVLTLFLSSFYTAAFASQDVSLEKIVVTASRSQENYRDVKCNMDIIGTKEIESSSANDISELLGALTSVNIGNYGGASGNKNIRMRGSSAAQVLVMIDGRPINSPRDGEVELNAIPLENIERVEVMHGAGSSLYGSSAMGGVVNIITKSPPKEGQNTRLSSSFGTFGTHTERFSHGARKDAFGYILTSEHQESEGHRDNSEFNSNNMNAKIEFDANDINRFTLSGGFYNSRSGSPGKITLPDIDDSQGILKKSADFTWKMQPEDSLQIQAKLYGDYDRLEFSENSAGSVFDTALSKSIHTTKSKGIEVQIDKKLNDRYRLICGLSYSEKKNDSTSSYKHRYSVRAGYIENMFDLSDNLNINLAARLDDYSNFGSELNPNLGFLYRMNGKTDIYGSIGRSFRAPTFNDLYWPDEGWSRGNPLVKPEKGMNSEAGLRMELTDAVRSSLTYYRNDYDSMIKWAPDANDVWVPTNIDSAIIDGLELKNDIRLTQNLKATCAYTFTRAKNDKTHKYIIYQPKNKADLSIKYSGRKGLTLELKGQFTDKCFYDSDNTIIMKKFAVFGIRASKEITETATCFAAIDNIFDKKYELLRDYPMPGFTATAGVRFEF